MTELDEFIVDPITDGWEQMVLQLGVESLFIDIVKWDNPGQSKEACRGVLNSWLDDKPGTGVAERTWYSVLKALETSGHRQLAEKLRREQFGASYEGPVADLSSLPGCVYGWVVEGLFVVITACRAVNGHSSGRALLQFKANLNE